MLGVVDEDLRQIIKSDVIALNHPEDSMGVYPDGSYEEIQAEVTQRLPILSKGGGYVFDAIHNIVGNTKPESIWAAFEAVHKYNAAHFS